MIELVGRDPVSDRHLYLGRLARLEDWPGTLDEPTGHFVLFLAIDAVGLDSESIAAFAERTLAQGAAYVCVWGPDCGRVHDIFDECLHGPSHGDDDDLVTTTWHADDTLDEALWFAVFVACPHDPYIPTCGSVLAVVVGRDEWAHQAGKRLTDPKALLRDVAG